MNATLDSRLGDLFASRPRAMANPWPLYHELRQESPVHAWDSSVLVSRYDDIKEIVRDEAYRKNTLADTPRAKAARASLDSEEQLAYDDISRFEQLQLTKSDPPAHGRLRRIGARAFSPSRVVELQQAAETYTNQILDRMEPTEVGDLIGLSYSLPLMIIADMLSVPASDRERIHRWAEKIAPHKGGRVEPGVVRAAHEGVVAFRAYIHEMVTAHRGAERRSELVDSMMDAEHSERLSTDELTAMFVNLLFAGHETTKGLISIGMYELLRHPEQWRMICANPALAQDATEELLRFVTPVQWQRRVAPEACSIGGVAIDAGTPVFAILAAGNRDPEVFRDPDVLDITRDNSKHHLSFGFGFRFCLGAALARMEATTALRALATRFPNMALVTEDLAWHGSAQLRAIGSVPVRFAA